MSVTSVSAANEASTASSAKSSGVFNSQLNANAFLTLFLTQLKYQDPTNPMESYELASQLAQFSSVEKLTDINANLTSLQSSLSSITNAQMIGLIGKSVVAQANTLQMTGGNASNAAYAFEPASGGTANVTITIYDESGNPVRTKTLGSQAAGQYQVDWDGRDDSSNRVSDGTYTFKVEATDSNGNALDVATTVSGTAYSYHMDPNNPYLILDGPDGVKIPIGNVMEVMQVTSS
jgi:flagellar basal-body rod modification protein FlgD